MTNSSKQLLEKALEKQVKKHQENNQRLTARLERLNEFYKKTTDRKEGVFSDMQQLKQKIHSMSDKTPQAKLLKFSKQNRHLCETKKTIKRSSPKAHKSSS
ncbi:hypothetical protein K501DRAFT_303718, partial [Backusella circina FSU 941]